MRSETSRRGECKVVTIGTWYSERCYNFNKWINLHTSFLSVDRLSLNHIADGSSSTCTSAILRIIGSTLGNCPLLSNTGQLSTGKWRIKENPPTTIAINDMVFLRLTSSMHGTIIFEYDIYQTLLTHTLGNMKAGHTCNTCFRSNSGWFSARTCGTAPSLVLCSVTKPAAVGRLKDFSQARSGSNNN